MLEWSVTDRDIRTKLKLRYGREVTNAYQNYQALALVVKQAFGTSEEDVKPAETGREAVASLSEIFGKGAVQTSSTVKNPLDGMEDVK